MRVGDRYTTPRGLIAEITNVRPDRIELMYVHANGVPVQPVKENLLTMTRDNMRLLRRLND
jgi:hypothetical protein